MPAYFQMGYDTENLVGEFDLDEFQGIILSPVNRGPAELVQHVNNFKGMGRYDILLDPQLYSPESNRGKLPEQPYFPKDLDTADLSSETWWEERAEQIAVFAKSLGVDGVCSPVFLPRSWVDEYYDICATASFLTRKKLSNNGIRTLSTVLVNFKSLGEKDSWLRIASIASKEVTDGFYVVVESDVEPRREFADAPSLFGLMSLIKALHNTGKQVIASHCSSDMILLKAAGATACATGKFFNLRRFTRSRYEDEENGGGGQLAYSFEQGLMAFLRRTDLTRLEEAGHQVMIGVGYSNNHWAKEISKQLRSDPTTAWVRLGWRQYLSWFGKTEKFLDKSGSIESVKNWLRVAEDNWLRLEDDEVLFDDPRNKGDWLRSWRQAIIEFGKKK